MKKIRLFALPLIFALLFPIRRAWPLSGDDSKSVIEDFSHDKVGEFPSVFRTYPFQRHKAVKVYSVQDEGGNRFLHASAAGDTQDLAVQIFDRFAWDISRFPKISWRWRAKSIPLPPPGSGEHFDDNACGVYVVFGGWGGKALKYTWSGDRRTGEVVEDTPNRFYITVKESGPRAVGQWQTVTIDVAEEYKKFFKSNPSDPTGFGLLTDGDGTHSPSVCDYDDFTIEG